MHKELLNLLEHYPDLEPCITDIDSAFNLLRTTYQNKGKLLVCGNGGSAADSDHIVGELMKGFELKRPIGDDLRQRLSEINPDMGTYLADRLQGALPAISLSAHAALASAVINDTAGDMTFAQQVLGYGVKGDTLIGISTSGNSVNVRYALTVARALGLHTIGLTGKTGGKMRELCDVTICVPNDRTLAIQERHLPIYHTLCIMLEQEFFG
ncbi:MAG: SIS domain-containing protein [Anaerolineaceae bacterium]|nr:SIS domain-containing protein [Anaerolineaceae bacterium]